MHNLSTFPLTPSVLQYLPFLYIESTVALVSRGLKEFTRSRGKFWKSGFIIKRMPPKRLFVVVGSGPVAICSPKSPFLNKPLVSILPGGSLHCAGITFVHSTPGRNIWSGNSCLSVTGGSLTLRSCGVSSVSGRGVVGVEGADVDMSGCAGHSGIYIEASSAVLSSCVVKDNTLTGISVVRGADTVVEECVVGENGEVALQIEDDTTM
ncbi:hypothetical protein TrRE_jg2529, partial [Triparma retinervis]